MEAKASVYYLKIRSQSAYGEDNSAGSQKRRTVHWIVVKLTCIVQLHNILISWLRATNVSAGCWYCNVNITAKIWGMLLVCSWFVSNLSCRPVTGLLAAGVSCQWAQHKQCEIIVINCPRPVHGMFLGFFPGQWNEITGSLHFDDEWLRASVRSISVLSCLNTPVTSVTSITMKSLTVSLPVH